jgi:hypothetical protein
LKLRGDTVEKIRDLIAVPPTVEFGKDETDENRFIVVQHNYVRREHTTTKSKKSRRVDLSRELRPGAT